MAEIEEAELIRAGLRGTVIDGAGPDGKRTVSADLLRTLCHELRDRIDPHGLRLASTIVTGVLDLTGLVVPFPLRFDGCEFDSAPVVEGAQLFELSLTGCPRLPGLVMLNRSTIEGRLQLTGGSFGCPEPAPGNEQGHAIEAISATVRGGIDLGWRAVSPSVDFTDVSTTFLANDPATWPPSFTIAGLTYERFEKPQGAPPRLIWDQAARCEWLSRQAEFDSGPYEQAARVFRQHGYSSEAERILMAQRRDARKVGHSGMTWPRRAVDAVYAIIGYGYRPSRVLWVLGALLLLMVITLELPFSQATLRATNGNGSVYSTNGLLVSSPARPRLLGWCGPGLCGRGGPWRAGEVRRLRRRRGPLLQPGALRDRHRHPADLPRPAHHLVPRPARFRRRADAVVAQPRHHARLAAVLDLRAVPGPAIPQPVTAGPRLPPGPGVRST
jgi:hypothetical protein